MTRSLTLIPAIVALVTSVACGSTSTSTTVGPSPVRCAVNATATPAIFPAPGGDGNLVVTAARECSWTASTQYSWVSFSSPAQGQGDGSVRFAVARNPAATGRRATIVVGSMSVDFTQEGAPCSFELDRRTFDLAATEGTADVNVQAPNGCAWTAASQTPWITIEEGAQGSGPGRVRFRVTANTGPAREGTLLIAGHQVAVRQRAPGSTPPPPPPPGDCAFTVDPNSAEAPSDLTDGTFAVQTDLGCSWSASSDQGWLTIVSGATGTGPQVVSYRASANDSTSGRTGRITVNGAVFTLQQAGTTPPSCNFDLNPNSDSVSAGGGTGSFDVRTGPLCAWQASVSDGWIDITSGSSGVGDGRVEYRVDANTSTTSRSGTITVGGQTFTINQEGAPSSDPITVTGDVRSLGGSCPDRTFTVNGQSVRTNGSTNYSNGNCGDLRNNQSVSVTGPVGSDDVLIADEVRF